MTLTSLPAASCLHGSAGSGTIDTGDAVIVRRPRHADDTGPNADTVLADADGHVFGHVYRTDDGFVGGRWASHGPAAWSVGHPTREAAEDAQIGAHLSNSLEATYRVDRDDVGDGIHWTPVDKGITRVESLSPIDLGVRAREFEEKYRTAGAAGPQYRVTITCQGREVIAFTPPPANPLDGTDHYMVIAVDEDMTGDEPEPDRPHLYLVTSPEETTHA